MADEILARAVFALLDDSLQIADDFASCSGQRVELLRVKQTVLPVEELRGHRLRHPHQLEEHQDRELEGERGHEVASFCMAQGKRMAARRMPHLFVEPLDGLGCKRGIENGAVPGVCRRVGFQRQYLPALAQQRRKWRHVGVREMRGIGIHGSQVSEAPRHPGWRAGVQNSVRIQDVGPLTVIGHDCFPAVIERGFSVGKRKIRPREGRTAIRTEEPGAQGQCLGAGSNAMWSSRRARIMTLGFTRTSLFSATIRTCSRRDSSLGNAMLSSLRARCWPMQ